MLTLGLQSIVFIFLVGVAVLTTQVGHEVVSFPYLNGAGITAWRVVTLDVRVHYVLISYALKEGRSWQSQTSLLWRQEDVLTFCRDMRGDKSRKMLNVSLLSPLDKNASGGWGLTPIREVFAANYEGTCLDFPLYVSFGGDRFGGANNLRSYQRLSELERVFPTTKRRKGGHRASPAK